MSREASQSLCCLSTPEAMPTSPPAHIWDLKDQGEVGRRRSFGCCGPGHLQTGGALPILTQHGGGKRSKVARTLQGVRHPSGQDRAAQYCTAQCVAPCKRCLSTPTLLLPPPPSPWPLQRPCWWLGNSRTPSICRKFVGVKLPSAPTQAPPRDPTNPVASILRAAHHPGTRWASLSPWQRGPGPAALGLFQANRAKGPPDSTATPCPSALECVSEKQVQPPWPGS